jgi:purine nucleosidase
VPLTIFPLDVTHQALVLDEHLDRIRTIGTPVAAAVAGMLAFYERWDVDKYGFPGGPLHDPCPVAYLLEPSLFSGKRVNVQVETSSEITMGALVVDWWGVTGEAANATVMNAVDAPGFMELVIRQIGRLG